MSFCRIIITNIHIINTGVLERNPRKVLKQNSRKSSFKQINPGQVSEHEQQNQIFENGRSLGQSSSTKNIQSIPASSSNIFIQSLI
jgi:hypothetical protein